MLLTKLHQHASQRGAQMALRFVDDGRSIDYRSLWDAAQARAGGLVEAGLRPDEVVLIFAPPGLDSIITFIGCMVAGGVPSLMPLPSDRQDPAHFWQQHEQLFRHIGHGMALVPQEYLAGAQAIAAGLPLRVLAQDGVGDRPCDVAQPTDADRIALLQHSSGTTGLKKGVALSYTQLQRQVDAYAGRLGLDPDRHRIVSWLPLYHDMGLIACLITPLTLGMEVIALDPFRWVLKPQKLFDAIEEHRGTHVWMPNFAFLHMVRAVRAGKRQWDLSSVEAFINCSEPCKPNAFDAFAERWRDHGVRPETLTCCYAMAETVFAVSQTVPGVAAPRISVAADGYGIVGQPVRRAVEGAPALHLLSCGAPLDGVEVRLVDDAGAPVADGCYGQIQVSAPFLFSGYYGAPERTAAVLADGWYRTGDIGMVMDGEVFVCGRIDDMIIVNGRNLYAHEIEKVVATVDGVLPGRVVAFPHFAEDVGSNQLVVVAESDITDDDARLDLGTAISNEIMTAVGVLPADVRIVPRKTILKTTSGKIDRRSNMVRYGEGNLVVWGS